MSLSNTLSRLANKSNSQVFIRCNLRSKWLRAQVCRWALLGRWSAYCQVTPLFCQILLQMLDVANPGLAEASLKHALHLILNLIQIWEIRRPHRSMVIWCFEIKTAPSLAPHYRQSIKLFLYAMGVYVLKKTDVFEFNCLNFSIAETRPYILFKLVHYTHNK